MNLDIQAIEKNWDTFIGYLTDNISEPRLSKLLDFYNKNSARISIMPASSKASYHNAFVGGYIDHVNRVIECSLKLHEVWKSMGATLDYTIEELIFSAANHDLGKIGNSTEDMYIASTDQWRKDKLGEIYSYNPNINFMTIPDRSLFLLQEAEVKVSMNEAIAIRCHDGLYDEANKQYFISYNPDARFKNLLPLILHQADLMASNIEFQNWKLSKLVKTPTQRLEVKQKTKVEDAKVNPQTQALGKLGNSQLKSTIDSFFDNE